MLIFIISFQNYSDQKQKRFYMNNASLYRKQKKRQKKKSVEAYNTTIKFLWNLNIFSMSGFNSFESDVFYFESDNMIYCLFII